MSETPVRLIAHRGNVEGINREKENTLDYIDLAIRLGYDVEVDVWGKEGQFGLWLGHDSPTHHINFDFLVTRIQYLWVHCKNARALYLMREYAPECRFFFHQTDDYALTSWYDIWCYPEKSPYGSHAVIVLPEQWMKLEDLPKYINHFQVTGVCSDSVGQIKRRINS